MKLAFVVQRYGNEVIGGAESLAKQLAEKISSELSYKIDIYTTCSIDYFSWKNFYPPGCFIKGNISVLRFPVVFPRYMTFFRIFNLFLKPLIKITNKYRSLSKFLETFWIIIQGPFTPSLIKKLIENENQYKKIFFFTYLYYPTIMALPKLSKRSVLIPTAHDETPFYFNLTKNLFKKAGLILTNTDQEGCLIVNTIPEIKNKVRKVGIGVDAVTLEKLSVIKNSKVKNDLEKIGSYILYLGRISKGKGVDKLIGYFSNLKKSNYFADTDFSNIKLLLAGKPSLDLNRIIKNEVLNDVIYWGQVSEEEKLFLIKNSLCVVNPSQFESLSLIVLEALALKKPVLVNGHSSVLRSYAESTKSVFSFKSEEEFKEILHNILVDCYTVDFQKKLIDSYNWVTEHYSWKKVLGNYQEIVEEKNLSG